MPTYHELTGDDWSRRMADWQAWWAGALDRPLITIEAYDPPDDGPNWNEIDDFITRFPLETPVDDVLDFFQARLDAIHFYGDAIPKWWPNFGAGIMAGFLGARVSYSTRTTWFFPAHDGPLAALEPCYDPDNVWWQRVQAITRRAVERWQGRVLVAFTDLGGNLDILASLRGTQQLLLDLYDAPDEVERLTRTLTGLWLRYYDELYAILSPAQPGTAAWAPPWNPGRGYMLQSDFSYMIAPRMFDRYVLPDLEACCAAMDYAFYHMDGKGQIPHLDRLLSLPRLRGIQWQPGAGAPLADEWLHLLARIRDGGKLCQVYVTREGAHTILRELGGAGFLLDIREDDRMITPAQAEAFLNSIASLI